MYIPYSIIFHYALLLICLYVYNIALFLYIHMYVYTYNSMIGTGGLVVYIHVKLVNWMGMQIKDVSYISIYTCDQTP